MDGSHRLERGDGGAGRRRPARARPAGSRCGRRTAPGWSSSRWSPRRLATAAFGLLRARLGGVEVGLRVGLAPRAALCARSRSILASAASAVAAASCACSLEVSSFTSTAPASRPASRTRRRSRGRSRGARRRASLPAPPRAFRSPSRVAAHSTRSTVADETGSGGGTRDSPGLDHLDDLPGLDRHQHG